MQSLAIQLFGKCSVRRGGEILHALHPGKTQELFCYLLIHRKRIHSREMLASQFWATSSTAQSKKSLRTTLWQLRGCLGEPNDGTGVLLIEPDSIQINPEATLSLDVADFEQACIAGQPSASEQMPSADQLGFLRRATELYCADLLEGCYDDWCLHERERLQNMYLVALDRLLFACELMKDFDRAWNYGARILRYDPACERTHQRLMRLHFLAGDRTGAARQYERCITALKDELDVSPSPATVELYQKICAGDLACEPCPKKPPASIMEPRNSSSREVFSHLRGIRGMLTSLRTEIEHNIRILDQALRLERHDK